MDKGILIFDEITGEIHLKSTPESGNNHSIFGKKTYDDWFLGSLDEVQKMYDNLHNIYNLGNFGVIEYQTSSEYSSTRYNTINFEYNFVQDYAKTFPGLIRPIRKFTDTIGAYDLRDTGPAGGLIFHINGTTFYECALNDISGGGWSNITNTAVTGTGTAIGTGSANTIAIISQPLHTTSSAKLCADYSI